MDFIYYALHFSNTGIHPNLNYYGISTICGTVINEISNEREKFQVFNGVHQLYLIMNTNVLFTLQTKWRLQHKSTQGVLCTEFLCWSFHLVCNVNNTLVFIIMYNWCTPLKTWNFSLSFDMWFMKVLQIVLIP